MEIECLLQELDHIDLNWRNLIRNSDDYTDLDNDVLRNKLNNIIFVLREYLKKNEQEQIAVFKNIVADEKVAEHLLEIAENTLVYYHCFSTLRSLQYDQGEIVRMFLKDALEQYIVRFDPDLPGKYPSYQMENEDAMGDALWALECLTEYYVKRLFVRKYIVKDFEDETGFSRDICQHFANLVEKYFSDIRLNIIMQEILMLD